MKRLHFRCLTLIAFAGLAFGGIYCGGSGNGNTSGGDGGNPGQGDAGRDDGSSPQLSLTLSVTGIGLGRITSDVGHLQCSKSGGTCTAHLEPGTAVTLSATSDPGYFFNGWRGGDCRGTGPCQFTLNQSESIQASFVNIAYVSNQDYTHPSQSGSTTNPSTGNLWLVNSDGTHATAVAGVAAAGIRNYFPSFSPDGNQLVFLSTRDQTDPSTANANGELNVWVVNADGSNLRPLAYLDAGNAGAAYDIPRWSPDSSQIVFTSKRDLNGGSTPTANGTINIWVVNVAGNQAKVLAGLDLAYSDSREPVWSPDGTKIAFISGRVFDPNINPNASRNIWVMNSDGSGLLPLTMFANGPGARRPQWSPDGHQLVFDSDRNLSDVNGSREMAFNIWKMNSDGSNSTALTHDTGSALYEKISNDHAEWSPDGRLITFESTQNPLTPMPDGPPLANYNVWAVAADGEQAPFPVAPLTGIGIYSDVSYWAPDSSWLIFVSNRKLDHSDVVGSTSNVWIVKPDGTRANPVTDLVDPAYADTASDDLD